MSRSRIKPMEGYKPLKFTAKDRSLLDKSPEEGLKRIKAKVQANVIMALAGSYTGASRSKRQFGSWQTSIGDADADINFDLPTLRERSRDLIRNNPLATGALHTKVGNVVGTGLSLKASVDADYLGMTPEQANEWNRNTEREYNLWAESPNCDIERTSNIYGLQDLAFRSVLENGDALALPLFVERPGVVYSSVIQLVEADRLVNRDWARDTDKLSGGVEKDDYGAPKNYHVLEQHPGAFMRSSKNWTWQIIPAFGADTGRRNVIHLYRKLRIGQTRGVPDLAPVISALKQLGDYTEAELTAALVAGLFTVFIKSENGDLPGGLTTDTSDSSRADQQSIKMGAGAIVGLGDNESIETANPGRPNAAFDPFVLAILRQIGVALELPFEVLVMHFQSSYSASRAALLQAWKFFRARRAWLADNFCQPIYEAWMWEAVALGRISAPGFMQDPAIRAAYLKASWIGDAQGQIDPLKEAQANALMEDRGWKTAEEVTAEMTGGDWEEKHKQRAKEHQMRVAADLEPKVTVLQVPADNNNGDTNSGN